MKKLIILLIFCTFVIQDMKAQSGPPVCDDIVTLQGKYFQCGGELFYPLATTYSFHVQYPASYTDYDDLYLTRNNGYGPRTFISGSPCFGDCMYEGCDAVSAHNQIVDDLTKMHQMGFNTFRTTFGPSFYDASLPPYFSNDEFVLKTVSCNGDFSSNPLIIKTDQIDLGRDRMFDFIDEILQIAHDCGLKVFLDIGYNKLTDDVHFETYKEYLELLALHINSLDIHKRQTLIAYVILEESGYTQSKFSKSIVCERVSEMYDILKTTDPSHLVSVGGLGVEDVMNWDPGVMKLDFFCPHLYPYPEPKKGETANADHSVERILGQLFWLKNNSTLPWVIGECGFGATDDAIGREDTTGWPFSWGCGQLHYPLVNGELETPLNGETYTQTTFAETILAMVRDCGGSGFTMWDFQECWAANPYGIPLGNPDVNGDALGLLRHGSANNPSQLSDIGLPIDKPVVSVFRNYLDANGQPPAIDITGGQPPTNYFDPYNHPTRTNISTPLYQKHHVTGTVEDIDGNPIKDAFVWGFCTLGQLSQYDQEEWDLVYTFTDNVGAYSLNSIDHFPGYIGDKDFIVEVKISAPGASVENPNTWGNISSVYDVVLEKSNILSNAVFNGITVPSYQDRDFLAWNSITAEDITIQPYATSEFKALAEIQLNAEFNANFNSEVHLWCTQMFPECSTFVNYKGPVSDVTAKKENVENSGEIELRFQKKPDPNSFVVSPNPSTGVFLVEYFSEDQSYLKSIVLYEITGRKIQEYSVTGGNFKIDLSEKNQGVYFIKAIDTQNREYIKKLILN